MSFIFILIIVLIIILALKKRKNKKLSSKNNTNETDNNMKKDKKLNPLIPILLFILILGGCFIAIGNSGISKKDIDDMSEKEMSKYIFNADDDKGIELYKKDKDTYKYLFNKYFDTNYDDVKLPTHKELEKMTDDKLTPEQSTKLELEDKKGYSIYLDNTVNLSKYDKASDSNSDSDTLKEDIAKELNDRATIEEVNYHNDSLGKNAVIVIKGKENLSDKMTSDGMRFAVANVVKGVKNSDIDLDDFTVDVDYPVTTKGDSTTDEHVIESTWSMNTVNNLSEDQLELLNENLSEYADSYHESSALK
ncbi:MAG: hypothetical protein E6647_09920 [Staphylococcus epidermidis]|nr:hypothetical protein [Staphylococcus epidermidis]MDH8788462.1 hypothetical protein [Staphylococcus epidermidis]MDH8853838.1 hypothetical protein [Staphylococcus epidermidis]MDH8881838.1 hypothetical protein [Staphylococcus epidermidis]MDU6162730.1 hypothetical protein [Staphylococcus epidermidis]